MRIGYARVSTRDQHPEAQHDGLTTAGREHVLKLGPRQVALARQMNDETGPDGKRGYTVAQIANEFGVTRPTLHRHLSTTTPAAKPTS